MSGLPTSEWQIDGITYRTTLLPATQGRGLSFRLIQALTPALESLAELKGSDLESAFAKVLAKVLGSLDLRLFEDLCDAMCNATVVPRANGEDSLKAEFGSLHFAGKYSRQLKCVVQFCKANGFLDFLTELQALGGLEAALSK
jgi:hypothetical protein